MTLRYALVLGLMGLTLSACGDDKAPAPSAEDAKARGEIQGGTISDAMLPLDSVTSQSPPLREKPESEAGSGGEAEDATSKPAPAAANPKPAGTAAPEASGSPAAEAAE